jgi:hypothetical protein
MKKIGLITLASLFAVACNNSANEKSSTDSSAAKDKTNMYDTGTGSSVTDTSTHKSDTSLLPNKMQDTGMKK